MKKNISLIKLIESSSKLTEHQDSLRQDLGAFIDDLRTGRLTKANSSYAWADKVLEFLEKNGFSKKSQDWWGDSHKRFRDEYGKEDWRDTGEMGG